MVNETVMIDLLLATLGCFGAGVLASLLARKWKPTGRILAHTLALLGALCALGLGAAGLIGGVLIVTVPDLLPMGGGGALSVDRLSAFFVVVVAIGAIASALYAITYTRDYQDKYSLAGIGVAFNVFLVAMVLVPLAHNVLTFLVLWETMSLASYFLVMTEHERRATRRAGWVYLVMTHVGFACLLAGFLLLAHSTGSMNFADWRESSSALDGTSRQMVFILLSAGFASKAGVIPLHIWLPHAHPAAPSHVSALMSGLMIKLGVYGLVRVGFDWLGTGPAWWGSAVLVVAAISAVLGVLYALVEHDLKRLLAYHSVENIGIILFGLGAGMLFQTYHLPALAGLALIAGLYHTLNHATFKSLLFMAAGAVQHSARTRNMEEMGGLIKRMPQTAVLFLVGSVAIAALPPLNGFVSEWLTFQALLLSFQVSATGTNLIFVLSVAALALTSGLAAACFIKAFGITFLALPRSERAERAREVGITMRAAMGLLAVACVVLGVAPFAILSLLNNAAMEIVGTPADLHFRWSSIVANASFATVSPVWIAAALVVLLVAIPIGLRIIGANTRRRYFETWACGRALQTARFEYTATAFANPFKRVFGILYRPVKELDIQFHPESRFFVRTINYSNEARSLIDEGIYAPLGRFVRAVAEKASVLQSGNVHIYLMYILVALLALMILAR